MRSVRRVVYPENQDTWFEANSRRADFAGYLRFIRVGLGLAKSWVLPVAYVHELATLLWASKPSGNVKCRNTIFGMVVRTPSHELK